MITGEIIDKIELKKQPDLLVEQDGKLYVHTYSYNYVIEFDEGGVEEQQKEVQGDTKDQQASEEGFSFAEFKNLNFFFLSGADDWSSEIFFAGEYLFGTGSLRIKNEVVIFI